jgi:PAS domain-containing protein
MRDTFLQMEEGTAVGSERRLSDTRDSDLARASGVRRDHAAVRGRPARTKDVLMTTAKELRVTVNGWESALDGLPTGVALVGGDGTIQWINRAGAAILGGARSELTGV